MYLLEVFCLSMITVLHIASLAYPMAKYSTSRESVRLLDAIGGAVVSTLPFLALYGILKLSAVLLPTYHAGVYYLAAMGPVHIALHSVLYRRELHRLKTYIVNKFNSKKSKEVDLDRLLKEADEIMSLETTR